MNVDKLQAIYNNVLTQVKVQYIQYHTATFIEYMQVVYHLIREPTGRHRHRSREGNESQPAYTPVCYFDELHPRSAVFDRRRPYIVFLIAWVRVAMHLNNRMSRCGLVRSSQHTPVGDTATASVLVGYGHLAV